MGPLDLTKPHESLGEWFLPDSPDRRAAGFLKYSPDHIDVELTGTLGATFDPVRGKRVARVFGYLRDGRLVTLVDHFARPAHISLFGDRPTRADDLFGSRAIVGAHIAESEEQYTEIRCRVPGLALWLALPTVTQRMATSGGSDGGIASLSYSLAIPTPEIEVTIDAIDASVKFSSTWSVDHKAETALSATTAGWIVLRPRVPQGFDWFLTNLVITTEFLAIASGSPMAPDLIIGTVAQSAEEVHQLIALNEARCCPYEDREACFMRRDTMRTPLEVSLTKWFSLYPSIETPVKLALSVFGVSQRFNHSEFLFLMQAVEGLSRATESDKGYLEADAYARIRRTLVTAIPAEVDKRLREKLTSQLSFGNELSLQDRLYALADRLPRSLRVEILASDGKLPRSWVFTRNYLSHWNVELRERILDGAELFYVNARLRVWIRVLYLLLVGVPERAIVSALRHPSRVSQDLQGANIARVAGLGR